MQNAKYISEANEVLAAESLVSAITHGPICPTQLVLMGCILQQTQQLQAETRAGDMRVKMERTNARMQNMVTMQTSNRIDNSLQTDKVAVNETEHKVRELYSDPNLSLPHESAKRRQLARLEKRLKSLRSWYISQEELRSKLDVVMDVHDRLCTAAASGDTEEVRQLLSRGVSVNVLDKEGFNALYYACGGGHLEIVKLLIHHGADLIDEDGRDKPLVVAAKAGHLSIVKQLLQKGAMIDQVEGQSGKTALHVATQEGHEDVVELLLNCGAAVNRTDRLGNTALHISARTPYVTIAVLLIDRGANINARNASYATPMQVSQSYEH